jgi:hypothetical protein
MIKHLKPKSEEEIRTAILFQYQHLSPNEKLRIGIDDGLFCLIKDAIENGANQLIKKDEGRPIEDPPMHHLLESMGYPIDPYYLGKERDDEVDLGSYQIVDEISNNVILK